MLFDLDLKLEFMEKQKAMPKFVSTQFADQDTRLFVSLPQSFAALLVEHSIAFTTVGDRIEFEYTPAADRLYLALWNGLTELRADWLAVCQNRNLSASGQLPLSLSD